MKIPRAGDSRTHQHETRAWRWVPERAAWMGKCLTCGAYHEASTWETMRLEHLSAAWADSHPLQPLPAEA